MSQTSKLTKHPPPTPEYNTSAKCSTQGGAKRFVTIEFHANFTHDDDDLHLKKAHAKNALMRCWTNFSEIKKKPKHRHLKTSKRRVTSESFLKNFFYRYIIMIKLECRYITHR